MANEFDQEQNKEYVLDYEFNTETKLLSNEIRIAMQKVQFNGNGAKLSGYEVAKILKKTTGVEIPTDEQSLFNRDFVNNEIINNSEISSENLLNFKKELIRIMNNKITFGERLKADGKENTFTDYYEIYRKKVFKVNDRINSQDIMSLQNYKAVDRKDIAELLNILSNNNKIIEDTINAGKFITKKQIFDDILTPLANENQEIAKVKIMEFKKGYKELIDKVEEQSISQEKEEKVEIKKDNNITPAEKKAQEVKNEKLNEINENIMTHYLLQKDKKTISHFDVYRLADVIGKDELKESLKTFGLVEVDINFNKDFSKNTVLAKVVYPIKEMGVENEQHFKTAVNTILEDYIQKNNLPIDEFKEKLIKENKIKVPKQDIDNLQQKNKGFRK